MEAMSQARSPSKSEEVTPDKLEKIKQEVQDSNETVERLKLQGKKLKEQIEELKKEVELRKPAKVDAKSQSQKPSDEKKKQPMPPEMEAALIE